MPVLRWGTTRERLILGLALIFGGGLGLQGASPYILWLLLAGAVAHAAGWAILPADGWRRIVAAIASSIVIWVLLTGPQSLWLLTASLAGWLLVRRRPWRAWPVLALPLGVGILLANLFKEYEWMPLAAGVEVAAVVAAAWVAAWISTSLDHRREGTLGHPATAES
jgi:hypothetical protein